MRWIKSTDENQNRNATQMCSSSLAEGQFINILNDSNVQPKDMKLCSGQCTDFDVMLVLQSFHGWDIFVSYFFYLFNHGGQVQNIRQKWHSSSNKFERIHEVMSLCHLCHQIHVGVHNADSCPHPINYPGTHKRERVVLHVPETEKNLNTFHDRTSQRCAWHREFLYSSMLRRNCPTYESFSKSKFRCLRTENIICLIIFMSAGSRAIRSYLHQKVVTFVLSMFAENSIKIFCRFNLICTGYYTLCDVHCVHY